MSSGEKKPKSTKTAPPANVQSRTGSTISTIIFHGLCPLGKWGFAHLVGLCPLGKWGFAHLVGPCPPGGSLPTFMQIRLKDNFSLDRGGCG